MTDKQIAKRLEERCHEAERALAFQLNQMFPVNTHVSFVHGRGRANGIIGFPAVGNILKVVTKSDHCHHKCWRDVRREEG